MKLAVVIATYQRPDGRTPELLTRTLKSLENQTHTDWKLFLIGDDYKDKDEFHYLSKLIPQDKIISINLPVGVERERYRGKDRMDLWNVAGSFAVSFGSELAVQMGYDYVCGLDHDDLYRPDHLQTISKGIIDNNYPPCIFTSGTYLSPTSSLPRITHEDTSGNIYQKRNPAPAGMIRSSLCVNHKKIRLRIEDSLYFHNTKYPADALYARRIGKYLDEIGESGIWIKKVTVDHLEEGYTRRWKREDYS